MPGPVPTVTVVVCAYNYEGFIAEALESALAQDYPAGSLEILVVDDGSTDGTPQVLAGFGDRIRVIRQENAGLNAATARGVEEATGEYIALLDADDVWLPGKLRVQVELLEARPEVGLVFSDMELMDGEGRVFAPSFHRQFGMTPAVGPRALGSLLRDNTVPAPSIVFRRSLASHVLPVAPEAAFQDWWLGVKVAEVAELACVPVPLVRYRVHGANMAVASKGEKWIANIRRDNAFRRWMLQGLPLDTVAAEDLIAAWQHYEGTVGFVAQRAGTTVRDEILVGPDERLRIGSAIAAARAAGARGDAHGALRQWLAARACDPWDAEARAGWEACIAALESADATVTVPVASPGEGDDPLAWAEDRYAEGDIEAAIAALVQITSESEDPALLAHAHADLAVIAVGLERWADATAAARAALRHDGAQLASLEVLAACAEQAGDALQAAHWHRRMTDVDPSDPAAWCALGRAELLGARFAEAVAALETAADLAPLPLEDAHRLETARAAIAPATASVVPPRGPKAPRALVCVDFFFPSIGGLEHIAEGVGTKLQELGWHVEVACRHLPERRGRVRKGMVIHEVHEAPRAELRKIVKRGAFDAVLAFSDPYAWPVPAALHLPPGPRVVVVPCVTANADKWVREVDNQRQWRELLERADVVVHNSERGFDAQLNRDVGVDAVYVPQAIEERTPAPGDFRAAHGLRDDLPLLLYVANLHPHKNHAGLLEALAGRPGEWQLLLAGHPTATNPEEADRVAALAAADPRVTLVPGLAPDEVAAAMRAADVFLCPSHSDAVPLVVQESMCAGLPWVATPAAGAVHDWAGGLILPVEDFGAAVDHLLAAPDALATLGAGGRAHWERCFHYDVAGACYDALLRGADRPPVFPAPPDALSETDAVRAAAYDALVFDGRPEPAGAR